MTTESSLKSLLIVAIIFWMSFSISLVRAGVVTVPRPEPGLPALDLSPPEPDSGPRLPVLPEPGGQPPDTGRLVSPELSPPELPGTIGTRGVFPRLPHELSRPALSAGKYFFVTGRVRQLSWAKIKLYRRRGGFFNVYDAPESDLLGSDLLDSQGNFRIGPIRREDGWFTDELDIVLVLELDSPYAVAYSEIYGTQQPYRFKLADRSQVGPGGGRFELGTINVDWSAEHYYPVRVYRRVLDRVRSREDLDRKIQIEFVKDVDEPVYMEEAGFVLMPYVAP